MAIASSVAVQRPLFRIIPPTRPVPRSMSVRSHNSTSAPNLAAAMAAAVPAQPPPTTTTLVVMPLTSLDYPGVTGDDLHQAHHGGNSHAGPVFDEGAVVIGGAETGGD